MRKTIATAILIACSGAAAFAADLPLRSAPPPPPYLPPVFTWTGGYFGVNAGYAFDYGSRFTPSVGALGVTDPGFANRPGTRKISSDGFTGGGQIGYNYQFGAGNGILVGLEADAAYTDLGSTNTTTIGGTATRLHSDMDFLGTVRGRLGYAFDRFLVYGTGGFAYGDVTNSARFFVPGGVGTSFYGSRSNLKTGYTYGGGIEYALPTESFFNFFHSSAVTVKAEYLHYDLGTSSFGAPVTAVGLASGATGSYNERVKTDGDLARVGLNYKF